MISFVVWKWRGPDPGREFLSEHVNVLRAAIARNCHQPHRFICITDDSAGLRSDVEALPIKSTRLDRVLAPRASTAPLARGGRQFPSCYRRLWNFSEEAARWLGPRIVALDIDVVVCGALDPLLNRRADFVGWSEPRFGWRKIAGGAYMLRTGSHPEVWDSFDPLLSPAAACARGLHGSDQAWMSYLLFPPTETWSSADGIVKLGWLPSGSWQAPAGIRMAFTAGHTPPWHPKIQERYPWIRAHWRL